MNTTGITKGVDGKTWAPAGDDETIATRVGSTLGIDVSRDQGRVDWSEVASTGYRFAYGKATEGCKLVDPSFKRNVQGARAAGIRFGAYHYFRPDDDAEEQAEFFLSVARYYVDPVPDWGMPDSLPPALDVEVFPSQPGVLATKVQTWLDVVEKATRRRPMIYSGAGFWKLYLAKTFQGRYPLWLAEYAASPTPPSGITGWTIWQYGQAQNVPGISTPVDLNRLAPGVSVDDLTWE